MMNEKEELIKQIENNSTRGNNIVASSLICNARTKQHDVDSVFDEEDEELNKKLLKLYSDSGDTTTITNSVAKNNNDINKLENYIKQPYKFKNHSNIIKNEMCGIRNDNIICNKIVTNGNNNMKTYEVDRDNTLNVIKEDIKNGIENNAITMSSTNNGGFKSHNRNNSCDGLLMHSRKDSESSSSMCSTSSSSHSRHNSGDSSGLFSKNIFEWKSNSSTELDTNIVNNNISNNNKSTSIFKWNLFSRHFDTPPCGSDNLDAMSVHSNTSTLSNGSKDNKDMTRDKSFENLIASSTALIPHQRPKELPAKSEAEKLKHEKEYLKMLENIKKKEEQETRQKKIQLDLQLKNEEQLASAVKIWTQEILPNWENMKNSRKTKDLWWKGLPPCVRSRVWYLAIGNELQITKAIHDNCMKNAEARIQDAYDNTITQIRLDISRTFPQLCLFQVEGPLYDTLHYMLSCYCCYNKHTSYVQGMSYICAVFILNISTIYEAFVCFCNFLNKSIYYIFYTLNIRMMQAYYSTYNELLKHNLPKLYKHFQSSGLSPDLYLLDWIYTLFTKAMNLDLVCKIWDLVMRDGEEFIFRTALGILHLHEDKLLEMDFLQGSKFLTKLPDNLNSEKLFKSISLMKTSIYRKSYESILNHHKSYV